MKSKPSPEKLEQFRSGGSDEPAATKMIAEHTNKTIRIRKDFETKLKEVAFRRSMTEGRRVSESAIINEALERYFIEFK